MIERDRSEREPRDGDSSEVESTNLAFDVDAALLVELGERLVARRSVALAELIKNAYDADATEVIVSFEKVTGSKGSIVILDDGSGMNLEAMKRGWMRIATDDAKRNERSARFGRPRTGEKGVGRFACGRLASRLSLESISNSSGTLERVTADFDWREFVPGRNLSDVTTSVSRELLSKEIPTSTTLKLTGLKDAWTERDIAEIRSELSDLKNPGETWGFIEREEYEPDPGFDAQISAPEFPGQEGSISDPFLDAAWGFLNGVIAENGKPGYELITRDPEHPLVHEPGDRIFPELAGVEFTIRMMVYQGSRFRGTGYSLAEARDIGRTRGGVRIYLDGFQVFSYGSPGDDWLELDQDRARRRSTLDDPLLEKQASGLPRPMLSLPGNMHLFGAVSLSRDRNPELVVSISRERLVQNETFGQLKRFVRDGINWMTVCYARERQKAQEQRRASTADRPTAANAIRSVLDTVERDSTIPEESKQIIVASLKEVESQLAREAAAHVSELSMLRILGSAGTTVMVFDHTLRAMAGQLDGIVNELETATDPTGSNNVIEFRQALNDLRSWSSMATGQGSIVGLLLDPEARTRRESLALRPLIEELRRGFKGYLHRFDIQFENEVPPALRTPHLHQAELYAVLLNLVTNSFKAVRGSAERRVCVTASATSAVFSLEVSDTGVGIPSTSWEDAFEPFFTTSQPDPVLGIGTGLGLKIVRDLARAWGGDAQFVEASAPWRAIVKLVVPYLSQA
ncbi:MAG: ATP-binding protein [Chloroflexota bacterium]|nr:ATP-binding protein [Chloroflexota bacterium]